jgi:hypothetical protein
VEVRLNCSVLWPLLQAVLQLQYELVLKQSKSKQLLDRALIAGSVQSRALRQTLSAVNRLRPATRHDLQLRGYEHLGDSAKLLVPDTSSALRTPEGHATMTSIGLPPPKLSGKRFWFTLPKQYATNTDIAAARVALKEVLGEVGAATAGCDYGISVFKTIADLLQGITMR